MVVRGSAEPGHVRLTPPFSVVNLKTRILDVIVPVDKIWTDFVFFKENVQYFHRCGALIRAIFPIKVFQFCVEFSVLQQLIKIILNVDHPVLTCLLQVLLPGQNTPFSVDQAGWRAVEQSRADYLECEVTLAQFISWD